MRPITAVQAKVLEAIERLSINDTAPSYRELACDVGTTLNNIHRIVHALKERGRLEMLPGCARTLRVVRETPSINLTGLTPAQLVQLRDRVDTELAARWRP